MRKIMSAGLIALLLTAGTALQVRAETGDKAEAIHELMQVMGADNLSAQFGQAMTQQLYQVLKTTRPELPPEALDVVREEVNRQLATDRDKLLTQIAAIYERSFTAAEMRELSAFYRTELGKRTVAVIPQIIQESMALGKSWGQTVGPSLMSRLETRFKKDQPAAGK